MFQFLVNFFPILSGHGIHSEEVCWYLCLFFQNSAMARFYPAVDASNSIVLDLLITQFPCLAHTQAMMMKTWKDIMHILGMSSFWSLILGTSEVNPISYD